MECVCGCGREIPKDLGDRNFTAATVALELLAWDKNRALPGPEPEGREGLIARGAECYERLLYLLHGEGRSDPEEECEEWIEESAAMRAERPGMTKRRLIGNATPNLSKEDIAQLDRRHPQRSFTGSGDGDARGAAATVPAEEDLVEKLERLRALHADGALTADEFAAAKARLLGRD